MTTSFNAEVAVIGLGLIGSAALRHLAETGVAAVGIGPREPTVWSDHDGPFASHYDSGRITRVVDDRFEWAELARRSMASYRSLTVRTGVEFHRPSGVIHVARHDRLEPLAAQGRSLGLEIDLAPADEGLSAPYRVPPGWTTLTEPDPAGHLDPRLMLDAQLRAASASGAGVVRNRIAGYVERAAGVELQLAEGGRIEAERVLVAAGAYTGALLPGLAFAVKAETTILARVDEETAHRHRHAPALLYDLDHPEADEVYLVPPVRYPDGSWHVKMGCNLAGDRYLDDPAAMNEWMGGDAVEEHRPVMEGVLTSVLPDLEFEGLAMKPCLVTYTSHGLPYVDRVSDRLFVAAGGNGSAAKSADALGELAADLVRAGEWTDPMPASSFRLVGAGTSG